MELLVTIVILGVLVGAVVLAIGGMGDEADASGCKADTHNLATAYERYRAEYDVDIVPAADSTDDGVERTLVTVGYIRAVSTMHDIDPTGTISVASAGSPC